MLCFVARSLFVGSYSFQNFWAMIVIMETWSWINCSTQICPQVEMYFAFPFIIFQKSVHSSNLQDLESRITADLKRHWTVHFISWSPNLLTEMVMLKFTIEFSISYQYDQRRPVQIDRPGLLHILNWLQKRRKYGFLDKAQRRFLMRVDADLERS